MKRILIMFSAFIAFTCIMPTTPTVASNLPDIAKAITSENCYTLTNQELDEIQAAGYYEIRFFEYNGTGSIYTVSSWSYMYNSTNPNAPYSGLDSLGLYNYQWITLYHASTNPGFSSGIFN